MLYAALAAIGYLCGSLPFSVWIGRLFGKRDIRAVGDGNPGGSNAWRASGPVAGLLAIALDCLKAMVPAALALHYLDPADLRFAAVAAAPVLGHATSPFLGFRGGKAVASTFGAWTALTLWEIPCVLGASFLLFSYGLKLRNDAWKVLGGFAIATGYAFLRGFELGMLWGWVLTAVIVLVRHAHELALGPQGSPAWKKEVRSTQP